MQYSATQPSRKNQPNQFFRDLLSVNGLNPWVAFNSSPRLQMFSSHIGQILVFQGTTERHCQTGMEREYGKYTFNIKAPSDIQIIKVIPRYPKQEGVGTIAHNPETLVIYEELETKRVGMLTLKDYCSYHQYFGFEYKNTKHLNEIHEGALIKGGTVFQDSPNITETGGYKYGRELNVAFMTMPGVAEDGIEICEDVLPHFAYKTYETRVVEMGSKRFPLNLYGTVGDFKPFPDIGDQIRFDGLLMCLRSYDKDLAIVEQGPYDLMEPDFINDKCIYAADPGHEVQTGNGRIISGRVIDIQVEHDDKTNRLGVPSGMEVQARKYDVARRIYYNKLIDVYRFLHRKRGKSLRLLPELHRKILEAFSVVGETENKVEKIHRRTPIDNWRIKFVIEYTRVPNIGSKLSDTHGGKGVICKIRKPEQMPVDSDGNRTDMIVDPGATSNRMNWGRMHEHYINAASRDIAKRIMNELGIHKTDMHIRQKVKALEQTNPELIERVWQYVMGYYKIVSPERMYKFFMEGRYREPRWEHIAYIVKQVFVDLYIPPENEPEGLDILRQIEKQYKPVYGPVSWINEQGERIVSQDNVRIGSMYIIMLEKTGDGWSAVSSAKVQHFGVISQVTNEDKYSKPNRVHAVRAIGESEGRIWVAYCGPEITADVFDRNNNPLSHQHILMNILSAPVPSNIERVIDRKVHKLGGSKTIQLIRHLEQCGGWKTVYSPYKSTNHLPLLDSEQGPL